MHDAFPGRPTAHLEVRVHDACAVQRRQTLAHAGEEADLIRHVEKTLAGVRWGLR